jgi:hypothetical protein
VLTVLRTHSAQQGSVVTEWSWNTHDKYCDTHLTLGACNSRAGTAAWGYALLYLGWCNQDANVFRWMEQCLCVAGSVTPTELVNTGHPQTVQTWANEDAIIAAVEQEPWRSSRNITQVLGLPQPRVLKVLHDNQLHPYHYLQSSHVCTWDKPHAIIECG